MMRFLEKVIYQTIWDTYQYLESTGRTDSFARFPYLQVLAGRAQGLLDKRHAWRRDTAEQDAGEQDAGERDAGERDAAEQDIQKIRYDNLLKLLSDGKNDDAVKNVADLSFAAGQAPEFAAYLNYYTGNRATLQLAYEMAGISYPDYSDVSEKWRRLRRVFSAERKTPLSYANIDVSHEVLAYLAGDGGKKILPEEWGEYFDAGEELHPMYVRAELAAEGARLLAAEEETGIALQLAGAGGRRFLAKHIARRLKKNVILIRAQSVWASGERPKERLAQAVRIAFLYDDIVCMHGITAEWLSRTPEEGTDFFSDAVAPFLDAGISVLLCTDGASVLGEYGAARMERISLEPLSREERETVWREFAGQYGLDEDAAECSVRYRLNASEIARMARRARAGEGGRDFSRAFAQSGAADKPALGQVIEPRVGFSDLMMPPAARKTRAEICCGAAEGYRIYEEWGMKERYPYGRAVSVLLAGPPGTGKTMTAHALAHELGIMLYQVDLSHMMDKYIGETEKHLEQVFDYAEKTNVVLFFDEADALFGRRAQVTEGKDRYANMEVSYLLQRVEQFDGVIVLATNFYHNIDKAFLRRMKYIVKYQAPDEALRRRIWESCLVPGLPGEALDVEYLARQFELTGGMIKNVIQCACIAALYEKRPLGMEHILGAVRMEYEKLERSVTADLWGEYGYLIETGR